MMNLIRRIPFALRVPLFTATLMILLGILASQQVLATLRQVQDARIRELAQLQVESLSVALGPLVSRNDIWEVYDTLDRTTGEHEGQRLTFAAVANAEGRLLAATNPRRAPVDSRLDALTEGAQALAGVSVSGNAPKIKLLAPIIYQGRAVGQILTEIDVSDLVAERRQVARLLLLGNATATILLAAFGYLAVRRMLMPVNRVVDRMRDSALSPEPIRDSEMPVGDNEMAQLAQSYNTMVGAIRAKAEADRRLAERERFVSLGRLSSSLAHEINNPLGGLMNAADTVHKFADRPDVVRESADLLKRGLGHLRDVARVTLDMNRLDHQGAMLGDEDFDDLKLLILPEISRRRHRLTWQVNAASRAGDLPAAPVRQIVLNLLLNAADAAGKDGHVGFASREKGETLCLEISDNGPGLSPAAAARLLGMDTAAAGSGAGSGAISGVGLRLVQELVKQLRGCISLGRNAGETTIHIELPLSGEAAC